MSTRSYICKENKNGRVVGVFCHWDGYPSHNGRILDRHYFDENKVDELMSLGNLDSLGTTIAETRSWHKEDNTPWEQCQPQEWEDVDACIYDVLKDYCIEFLYIYKYDGCEHDPHWRWRCYSMNQLRTVIPEMYTYL